MQRLKYCLFAAVGVLIAIGWSLHIGVMAQQPNHSGTSSVLMANASSSFAEFVRADTLYRSGDVTGAEQLYRQLKPQFENHNITAVPEPIYSAEALSAGSAVYWRDAQAAEAADNGDLMTLSLDLLMKEQPEFVPGMLMLANYYNEQGRGDEAIAILDRAATRYPGSPDIVMMQAKTLADNGKHVEASIVAREFSVLNLDHPQSSEFAKLAKDELKKFSKQRQEETVTNGVINIITGIFTGKRVPWDSWESVGSTYKMITQMLSDEKDFGAEAAKQYKEQLPLVENPEVIDYVTQLGLQVARPMGRDFDYEFYVVKDNSINAFALPGGKIFVNTGAILAANSQAELAGLLAHEAAHSVLSHGLQGVYLDQALNDISTELPFGNFLTRMASLQYNRDQERQSDVLGTRVLATSGYAADGLRNFMAILDRNTQSTQPEYLSTHPLPANRVAYLEEIIQRNGYNRYALEGVDKHSAIQAILGQTT